MMHIQPCMDYVLDLLKPVLSPTLQDGRDGQRAVHHRSLHPPSTCWLCSCCQTCCRTTGWPREQLCLVSSASEVNTQPPPCQCDWFSVVLNLCLWILVLVLRSSPHSLSLSFQTDMASWLNINMLLIILWSSVPGRHTDIGNSQPSSPLAYYQAKINNRNNHKMAYSLFSFLFWYLYCWQ